MTFVGLLGGLTLLLLWPSGVLASVIQTLKPVRCIARFAFSWIESTTLSVVIVSRTISKNLLSEASLTVGAAAVLLAALLTVLVWLIHGYRKHAPAGEHDRVR